MSRFGSEEPIQALPRSLQTLLEYERFHLYQIEHFQNLDLDPEFDKRYLPQNCGAFELPCFWVARKHLYIYSCDIRFPHPFAQFVGTGPNDTVLFPIHPLSVAHYTAFLEASGARNAASDGLRIFAVPTSSIRTLLAWPEHSPEDAFFVKTTLLPSAALGDNRVFAHKAASSVGVTQLLEADAQDLPGSFHYFPESLSVVPRQQPDGGVTVRAIPPEIAASRVVVAPLFALLGASGRRRPVFLELVERSKREPMELIEEVFCDQFCRMWLELFFSHGLLPEFHGQNLLLAIQDDFTPQPHFYYRDFHGLLIDWELRRAQGRQQTPRLPYSWSWYEAYGTLLVGEPYCELLWWKLKVSLRAYLHRVLNELNRCLQTWHRAGQLPGPRIADDAVIAIFSRQMTKVIEDVYGMRVANSTNLYAALYAFVRSLLRVRGNLIAMPTR